MQKGEVSVDQAHRGYTAATDGEGHEGLRLAVRDSWGWAAPFVASAFLHAAAGFASPNPLFFKYTPDDGKFVGQVCAAAGLPAGPQQLFPLHLCCRS